jgi:GNAT superfamily N-acetyltransferase
LWDARGRKDYQENHPDETASDHYPMVYAMEGRPVGVLRVDIDRKKREAIFRRVAIIFDLQRQGIGRQMMRAAEEFAVNEGCEHFAAEVATDAIPFWSKLGYTIDGASDTASPNPRMKKEANKAPATAPSGRGSS